MSDGHTVIPTTPPEQNDPPRIDLAVLFDTEKQAANPRTSFTGAGNRTQWAACIAAVIVTMDDSVHQLAEAMRCSPQELMAQATALAQPTLERAAAARAKRLVVPGNGLRIVH